MNQQNGANLKNFTPRPLRGMGQKGAKMDYSLELIMQMESEGLAPTECPEGCIVEPDGLCPHGYESKLMELGYI